MRPSTVNAFPTKEFAAMVDKCYSCFQEIADRRPGELFNNSGGNTMENYLFVYYGGKMASTPAELKKSMDDWENWFKNQEQAVIETGNPTIPGKLVNKRGVKALSGKIVTGYSIFKADNIDEAIAIAKTSPQIDNGEIAIYPIMPTMQKKNS